MGGSKVGDEAKINNKIQALAGAARLDKLALKVDDGHQNFVLGRGIDTAVRLQGITKHHPVFRARLHVEQKLIHPLANNVQGFWQDERHEGSGKASLMLPDH